jgi:DNA-binding cell septation regulator SpoVG
MWPDLRIRHVQLVPVVIEPDDATTTFKGWVSAVFGDGLVVDGFGLHRSALGEYTITFPARRSPNGKLHNIVRTTSPWIRDEIERRLLEALKRQGAIR